MERFLGNLIGRGVSESEARTAIVERVPIELAIRNKEVKETKTFVARKNLDSCIDAMLFSGKEEAEIIATITEISFQQYSEAVKLEGIGGFERSSLAGVGNDSGHIDLARSRKRRRFSENSHSDRSSHQEGFIHRGEEATLQQLEIPGSEELSTWYSGRNSSETVAGSDCGDVSDREETSDNEVGFDDGEEISDDSGMLSNGQQDSEDETDFEDIPEDAQDPKTLDFSLLNKKQFRGLITMLRKKNDVSEQAGKLSTAEARENRHILQVLLEKYNSAKGPKSKPQPVNRDFPLNNKELAEILQGPGKFTLMDCVSNAHELWRISCHSSKCQLRDYRHGIYAGKSLTKGGLNTSRKLREEFTLHANFSNRHPTFLISTTSSYDDMCGLLKHFKKREHKVWPARTIMYTLVNPMARMRNGRPIIPMRSALKKFRVNRRKIGRPYEFYKNEWVIPLQVHPDEIVWHWREADIERWMLRHGESEAGWREKVALPALREHERCSLMGMNAKELRRAVAETLKETMPDALIGIIY